MRAPRRVGLLRFKTAIVLVDDLAASTHFYRDVLGLSLAHSSDDFSRFEGGLELYRGDALIDRVFPDAPKRDRPWGDNNVSVYLETEDLDAAFLRASAHGDTIHEIRTEPWGQRMFRVADPEGRIVEVGTPLA